MATSSSSSEPPELTPLVTPKYRAKQIVSEMMASIPEKEEEEIEFSRNNVKRRLEEMIEEEIEYFQALAKFNKFLGWANYTTTRTTQTTSTPFAIPKALSICCKNESEFRSFSPSKCGPYTCEIETQFFSNTKIKLVVKLVFQKHFGIINTALNVLTFVPYINHSNTMGLYITGKKTVPTEFTKWATLCCFWRACENFNEVFNEGAYTWGDEPFIDISHIFLHKMQVNDLDTTLEEIAQKSIPESAHEKLKSFFSPPVIVQNY